MERERGVRKANRTSFRPGQSGNPGGRPKEPPELREAIRSHAMAAVETLVKCLGAKQWSVRVRAAEAILDRAYGKPAQTLEVDSGDRVRALMQRFVDGAKKEREGED